MIKRRKNAILVFIHHNKGRNRAWKWPIYKRCPSRKRLKLACIRWWSELALELDLCLVAPIDCCWSFSCLNRCVVADFVSFYGGLIAVWWVLEMEPEGAVAVVLLAAILVRCLRFRAALYRCYKIQIYIRDVNGKFQYMDLWEFQNMMVYK